MRQATAFVMFLLIAGVLFPAPAVQAQVPDDVRQRRREFIQDLLKGLIESQADPHSPAMPQAPPPRNNAGPQAVTPQMVEARNALQGFTGGLDRLIQGLNEEQQTNPQLRAHLGDALRLKADSDVLLRNANRHADAAHLVDDFRVIDQNWRVLSHRLGQVPRISATCRGYIAEIQKYDERLCSCLNVKPQLDRAELVRLTTLLQSNFDHLLRDLYYEQRGDRRMAPLFNEGKTLLIQINQATSLIDREEYDPIVEAYRKCLTDWRPYATKLRQLDNERIARGVREIEELGRAISEQLWLPVEIDREYVVYLTNSVEANTARLFSSITVNDLLQCENPGRVVNTAREFQRLCGEFARSFERQAADASSDQWIWDFRLFDVQWNALFDQCQGIERPEVRQRFADIQYSIDNLKQIMGQGPYISHQDLQQIAAQLDQLSHELEQDVHQNVITFVTYDASFRNDLKSQTTSFHEAAHDFHESLVRGYHHGQEIGRHLETIFAEWMKVKMLVSKCNAEHKQAFGIHRREIEPLMVKLQVIYAQ